jgi:hypothetical protein
MRTHLSRIAAIVGLVVFAPLVWGQAVPSREPSGTHIFPAGARQGTVVTVRVGGECLPPGMKFHLTGDGVSAPAVLGAEVKVRYEPSASRLPRDADGIGAAISYPREWQSEVTVAASAAPGVRFWRVSGAWGGTRPRPFVVGDLPEFIETEPNSRPDRAERITLPVVVNGQIAGERDQDYFVFAARAGEVVVCDVMAARIGSPLDPVVTIADVSGSKLEVQEVRVGGDPVVAFRAPATGDYRLHVANLGFQGGPEYVYRITLSTRPYAAFAFPPGGRTNETRAVDLYTLTGSDRFDVVHEQVTFPGIAGPFWFRGTTLSAGEWPEMASTGTNPAAAQELTAPVTVNGRFLAADQEDWYRFSAKKGEAFTITGEPFTRDSAALPSIALLGSGDGVLASASAASSTDGTAAVYWSAPADGVYRLRLRDLQFGTRGGPEFIYRLTVRRARPDFSLRLGADCVNVVQAGKTEIDLQVRRSGGFAGPVDLVATGLPEGVTIEPARVPEGVSTLKLTVSAKADARPADAVVHLSGKALLQGKMAEHRASVPTIGCEGDTLYLTVQHKPIFRLSCNEAYQYAHRGTIYPYALTIERLDGFNGPITLQLCDRQVQDLDGIDIVESLVAPGVTETPALVYLPESMHASVQHHSRPYAQGYATFTDRWGQKQTLLAVCDKRCMIRTLPPVARLRAETNEITAAPGTTVDCRLVLERTSNFTAPAKVELIPVSGFRADPVTIDGTENMAVVRVRVGASPLPKTGSLQFRATGKLSGGATLVSEATITMRLK